MATRDHDAAAVREGTRLCRGLKLTAHLLQGLRRMVVFAKPEDQALYCAAGWQVAANPGRFMEILRNEVGFNGEDSKGAASK